MEAKHAGFDPAPAGGFRMENGRPQIVPGGAKRTPGPWVIEDADNSGERFNIYSDHPDRDGAYVAAVWSDESATGNDGAEAGTPQYVTDEEAAANAHIIAAAPDMYDALREIDDLATGGLVGWTPQEIIDSLLLRTRAALARADGRE